MEVKQKTQGQQNPSLFTQGQNCYVREMQINFSILTALFDTTGYGLSLKYLKISLGLNDLDLDSFKSYLSVCY